MLTFHINNREIPIIKISYKHNQKKLPEVDITIPAVYLYGDSLDDMFLADCRVVHNGTTLLSGIIAQQPFNDFDKDLQLTTRIKMQGELARLEVEAGANLHFQNIPVSTAISTVLAQTQDSTWAIDNTFTLTDANITLDLRSKQTIWSQLTAILEKCRYHTDIRYSHESGGTYYIDIGTFADKNYEVTPQQDNLLSKPKFKRPSARPIKSITPITGTSGDQPVDLSLALSAEPALATDADYPIVGNRVINNTIDAGIHIQKQLSIHKTKNDEFPDANKKEQVALSAYGQARREMSKANPHISGTVEMALASPPLINQLIYMDITIREKTYNPFTQQSHEVITFQIRDWVRVVAISADFKNITTRQTPANREVLIPYKIEVSTAEEREDYDGNKYLIEQLSTFDGRDSKTAITAIASNTVVVNHSSVASDCSSGWGDGKEFSFTPPVESGATNISYTVDVPLDRSYVVTQSPDTIGTELIICVSGENGTDWDASDSLELTTVFTYT